MTRLIIIGEGPGRVEKTHLKPFIGPSGRLLDRVLRDAGLERDEAHVTNAMLCMAEDDAQATKLAALSCCAPRLANELAEIDKSVPVLALGAAAVRSALGVKGIMKSRGFVWEAPVIHDEALKAHAKQLARMIENAAKTKSKAKTDERIEKKRHAGYLLEARATFAGRKVVPSTHPAFILRGADGWFPVLIGDVQRFARVIDGSYKAEDIGPYKVVRDAAGIRREVAKLRGDIAVDVETAGPNALKDELICVGLSDGTRSVEIYPWVKSRLSGALHTALAGRRVVMHNGPQFDHIVLAREGVRAAPDRALEDVALEALGKKRDKNYEWDRDAGDGYQWEDTLIAHHSFASHLPKSLAHVASVYCDTPPWKIIAKGKEGEGGSGEKGLAPWELREGESPARRAERIKNLQVYNIADVRLTALAWQRMQPDLEPEKHTYESDKRIALMCQRMTQTGICLDVEAQKALAKSLRARKRGLLGEMRKLTGVRGFHPARLGDVRQQLFGRFRGPAIRPTPTGLASTSNETLEAIKVLDTRAGAFADLLLRWRAAAKTLGTYVEEIPLGADGRVHPPWKLGPVTGRLSCWLMTLPRFGHDLETQVRALYIADKRTSARKARIVAQIHDAAIIEVNGEFVYFDLSQAEARLAAYFSGDANLIAACESDIHLANALVVFSDIEDAVKRLTRGNEKSPSGAKWKSLSRKEGGCKEERDVAKNAGFAVWYRGSAERVFITLRSKGFPVTMRACEEMVRRFSTRYRRYYDYIDENTAFCHQYGHLRTTLSRRIRWLGWHAPETEIANFPIQSGIADLQNDRLPLIEDSLPKCSTAQDVEDLIREVWGKPILIPNSDRQFVIPNDIKRGERWSDFG